METNKNQNEQTQISDEQFLDAMNKFKSEIEGLEYFVHNGLRIELFRHQEPGDKVSTIIKVVSPASAKSQKIRTLYIRKFEGYSAETQYYCMFFLFRDIQNQGLTMMHRLAIETELMDKELEKKVLKTEAVILDKNGKAY